MKTYMYHAHALANHHPQRVQDNATSGIGPCRDYWDTGTFRLSGMELRSDTM